MGKRDANVVMVLGIIQHTPIEQKKMVENILIDIFATVIQSTAYNSRYLVPLTLHPNRQSRLRIATNVVGNRRLR